jgi:NitT/TauT family transport system ATP-binding protein
VSSGFDSGATTQAATRIDDSRVVLSFEHIEKRFMHAGREVVALDDVSLSIRDREFVAIVGPSGCGKSTLLKMASGLVFPSSGQVFSENQLVKGVNNLVGFVTQESKLFPWLTLLQNVEFPLGIRNVPAAERRSRAMAMLEQVGLHGFEQAYPHQLSGGMQKRGSIARTLVYEPKTMLMDEPFGALDAQTKLIMQQDLLDIWTNSPRTILFITHDLVEAVALADRVVVMTRRPGRIKHVFDIPLPRPRDVFSLHEQHSFQEIYGEVWNYFKTEIAADRVRTPAAEGERA